MLAHFPTELLPLIRCLDDEAPLGAHSAPADVARCSACRRSYPLEGPVLRLGVGDLHPESDRERQIRDSEAETGQPSWDTPSDHMEIGATLEALDLHPDHRLLELGPGRGRFTRIVQHHCRVVVGIDISLGSLRVAAGHLSRGTVALVQGDATQASVEAVAFDRILGTLTSNLPDRSARENSYRAAARALRDDGKFVFSTHYYGPHARLAGEIRSDRYMEGGIFRYLLTPAEIREEMAPYFGWVRIRPICVVLPLSMRLRLPLVAIDRVARRIPGVRALGSLLLVEARAPRR